MKLFIFDRGYNGYFYAIAETLEEAKQLLLNTGQVFIDELEAPEVIDITKPFARVRFM